MQATFKRPALLGDFVDVVTSFSLPSVYRGRFHQKIERSGDVLVATVDVVCLNRDQNLIEFPMEMAEIPPSAGPERPFHRTAMRAADQVRRSSLTSTSWWSVWGNMSNNRACRAVRDGMRARSRARVSTLQLE